MGGDSRFRTEPVLNSENQTNSLHHIGGPFENSSDFIQMNLDDRDEEKHDEQLTYQTSNQKTWSSLRYLTREALPKMDHYRNLNSIVGKSVVRPTLEDLRSPDFSKIEEPLEEEEEAVHDGHVKFGWIKGVLVRCLLNIWSVILFLRLPWVAGQAGILQGIGIILAGNVVTTITTLSMSAISTNGVIKAGGTYYMISRSLGPEFGSAIGLIFAFANAVAVSMNVIGFCESVTILMATFDSKIIDGEINDIRIIGTVTLVMLFVVCVAGGMAWETRAQIFLLVILVVSMMDVWIGTWIGPLRKEQIAKGYVGFNDTIFYTNLQPDYRMEGGKQHNFISIFAVFFPACTGILAGANISGDLKDPSSAIPKGTLLAIFTTAISYIIFVIFVGAVTARDATGVIGDVDNGTFLDCGAAYNVTCAFGLENNFMVLELVSIFGPLIYAGCFAATLSSALACLVSAPKLFQALCKDRLFPYIHVFEKGYGKSKEPYRAYALTFAISLAFIIMGDLNSIAPIISNFFMAAYALINYSCFHASLQHSPGWRPTFKYYNKWLSLFGAILCGAVMLLMEWWTAVLTAAIIVILYLFVVNRKLDVNWGSSVQGQTYRDALASIFSLEQIGEHVKTFRPQILVLCGPPSHRPPLVHFANCLTKSVSLLIAAEWPTTDNPSHQERAKKITIAIKWLEKEKIQSFYALSDNSKGDLAAKAFMTSVGLGKLRPNIVMIGFKTDWRECSNDSLQTYFKIIHATLDAHLGLCILRVPGKLDYSRVQEIFPESAGETNESSEDPTTPNSPDSLIDENSPPSYRARKTSKPDTSTSPTRPAVISLASKNAKQETESKSIFQLATKNLIKPPVQRNTFRWEGGEEVSKEVIDDMLRYTMKQPKGTVDVWWLFDDGGLTMLLPYILTTRSKWSDCSLRIFCISLKQDDFAEEHQKMAELVFKFRIEFSDVLMIADIQKPPKASSVTAFNDLISKFKKKGNMPQENNANDSERSFISDEELAAAKDKTRRHIRLKELLVEHSKDATLIVMTLPVPTKDGVSAPLYQAWLETLTKDLPPFLLIRGNQEAVLTLYS